MTDFDTASQEARELCLCGGGPMGRVEKAPAIEPVATEPDPVPSVPVQGDLFGDKSRGTARPGEARRGGARRGTARQGEVLLE